MIRFYEDNPHKNDLAGCLIRTVWTFCALLFFYFASYNMASTVLTSYTASGLNRVASALVLFVVSFIFETILPFSAEIDYEKNTKKSYRSIYRGKCIGMLIIILTITAVLSVLFRERIYAGIAKVTEVFFNVFNRIYATDIRLLGGKSAYAGFAMTFVFTALTVIYYALAKIVGRKLISAIPAILLVAVPMIDGRTPEWFALSCLVIACIIIINEADAKERFFETFLRVGMVAMAFLVSGVLFSGRAEVFLEKAEDAKRFQSILEEKLKIALGQSGYSTMFIDNTDLKYNGTTQMTVEIEDDTIPSVCLYYKNFTGQDYILGAWNRAGSEFDKNFNDDYFDDLDTEESRRILAQNIYDYVNLGYSEASIRNVKTVYKTDASTSVPYFSHINDDYLKLLEGDVNPTTETSYDTIELPLVIPSSDYESLVSAVFDKVLSESSGLTVDSVNFFKKYNQFVRDHYLGYDNKIIPDELIEFVDEGSDFEWETWEFAVNSAREDSLNYRNSSRLLIADYIKEYLAENYEYTTKFDELGYGEDAVTYFLEDSREGCCRHFASAATLMLREAGVPARYASGYVVKPSMFGFSGNGIKATVKDYSEHAWVEIYLDNIGWIPYEFTPGYEPGIEGLPTEKNFDPKKKFSPESKTKKDTPTPKPTEEPKEETPTPKQEKEPTKEPGATNTPRPKKTSTPVPTGGGKGGAGKGEQAKSENGLSPLLKGVIIGSILLILIFMAAAMIFKRSSDKLLGDIRKKAYRNAVKRMNRRVYRKLVATGKMSSGAPDAKLREAVAVKTGDEKLADKYMEIVIKAAFSTEEITKEEADLIYGVYKGKTKKQ